MMLTIQKYTKHPMNSFIGETVLDFLGSISSVSIRLTEIERK